MTGTTDQLRPSAADGELEVDELLALTVRRKASPWRWALVAVTVVLLGGWALVAARSLQRDPGVIRSPLLGRDAPQFRLPSLEGGGEVDSATYRDQIVVVNFWASWCVPCREEAPELEAFAGRAAGRGVSLVGIVYNDDKDKAEEFRQRFGLSFPQAFDPGGRTAIDFGVYGVPETYVIDRQGKVMAKLIGATTADALEQIVASVDAGQTVSKKNDRYRRGPGGS